jgi:hypothetical protein
MQILISGSAGLIGSALVPFFKERGHAVCRLVRSKHFSKEPEIVWNPVARILHPNQLEGFDVVIHLAGEPIARGRWTKEKKRLIQDSRVKGTQFLSETLARLTRPPRTLLCASAIGIYGDRGEEILTEESPPGTGFLAEVGRQWEKACEAATSKGIRVVHLRFGMVLSPNGGALKPMLPIFRMGLGAPLGHGQQWMSWIALADVLEAIHHLMAHTDTSGPVNIVAPNPVRNREFTRTLASLLHRPTCFPVPAWACRILFGELAQELLLASTRVEPTRLKASGFRFRYPDLESALKAMLNRR